MSKKKERQPNPRQERETKSRFDQVENFVRNRPRTLLYVALGLSFILALLLFDVKPSTGGDDTVYILQAHNLISKWTLPVGFKSPGYPLLLAAVMLITGLNVVLLKFSSFLLYLGSIATFYFVFRKRLEPFLFAMTLAFFALNLLVLDYSHQTYSEIAFLFVELWTVYFLWNEEDAPDKPTVRGMFLLALCAMAGFYVRAIGATLPIAIGLWYVAGKRWKTFLSFAGFCVLLYIPWKVAEYSQGIVVMGQASDVLLINPYNPGLGPESFGGFVQRFLWNLIVHFNYMFPRGLQLPYDAYLGGADGRLLPNGMAFLGVLLSTVVVVGIVRSFRRGTPELKFLALYFSVYIVSICFALQTLFATPRMLVPVVPILLILFFVGVQGVVHRVLGTGQNRTPAFKGWMVAVPVLMALSSFVQIGNTVSDNLPILRANLGGDPFYGFSPDWVNYLKASQWVERNLPKDSTGVICRKPELFQIYTGGYDAYGVYSIEATDPDTIVTHWKRWHMTHLLYDNFQWTTTLQRYVKPVADKYPRLFELIHQEGTSYPSYIYKLDYDSLGR